MLQIEIIKITNNRFNIAETKKRNGILFHVKIQSENEEPKYYEFGIEKVLRRSVALRCSQNHSCSARLSAKHNFETYEIGVSGKNKI